MFDANLLQPHYYFIFLKHRLPLRYNRDECMGMELSNLLELAMIFFVLSLFAQLICSDLKFPPDLAKAITIIRWLVSGCTVAGSTPKWNLAGVFRCGGGHRVGDTAAAIGLCHLAHGSD